MTYYSIRLNGVDNFIIGKRYIRVSFVSKKALRAGIDALKELEISYNDLDDDESCGVIIHSPFNEIRHYLALPDMLDIEFFK